MPSAASGWMSASCRRCRKRSSARHGPHQRSCRQSLEAPDDGIHSQRARGGRRRASDVSPSGRDSRELRAHRHEGRVRRGRMRCLHRPDRRPAGRLVPGAVCAGRRPRRAHDRGGRGAGAATRVHGSRRRSVRDLHARDDHGRPVVRREPDTSADAGGARRQPVPLYGLRGDLPGDPGREAACATGRHAGTGGSMRSAISPLELRRPRSVQEALVMLRDDGPLVPIAGATDLYVALNFGTLAGYRFLDLWALEPLRRIETRGAVLSIGALATYTSLTRSRLVKQRLPMLVAAARQVGGIQIQNRGTIGGNIANASPAGDTLPVLAAADAVVVAASAGGTRRIPLIEFYTGYRRSVLAASELIVGVEI